VLLKILPVKGSEKEGTYGKPSKSVRLNVEVSERKDI
jgi:hypothetical protein